MLTVLHYNNNERCEKNGTRTVLRTVQYPSKAQGGELVKKKIKSKAPITYKHSMMSKCLEVFENGSTILGTETNYSAEEVESEEELEQEWPERNAESDEESNESIIGDHDEAQLENNDESELTESSSEEEELMEESMEESNFVEEPIVDDSSIHPFSSPSKASDFDFSRKRKADFEESTSKFKMSKIESSLQSSDLQSVTEQPKKQVASQSDPDLIIIKDCGMPQNVYTFTPPTEIFLQTKKKNPIGNVSAQDEDLILNRKKDIQIYAYITLHPIIKQ
uniref:Uncharacterized protein n=1 Tax=Panagrolaimus superbus TaxID=310955 RepID=A0A914XUN8_9BILA